MGEKIMYGVADSVVLATGDAVDSFETLENYLSLEEAALLLSELGVDNDKLRGLVAAWALRKAGLE
jgi:hypothetical protein